VQKDPRPKENSRRWTYKLMLWKPVSWKDQISARHGEQTVLLRAFMEISRERSCYVLMEKHAKVSERYSRQKVQGTNRIQFRTSSEWRLSVSEKSRFQDAINLKKR